MFWNSVQFSHSVVSYSMRPNELQHTRPPCPSPTPGVHTNSSPLSWWCHPAIILCCPLLLPLSIFPSIRVFQMSQLFTSGGQSIEVSVSTSVSPSNEYLGLITFGMDCLDLLAVQGTLKSLLQHHSSKPSILRRSAFFIVQISHPYMTTEKTIALTNGPLLAK